MYPAGLAQFFEWHCRQGLLDAAGDLAAPMGGR
jgi:hypothetical protein